MKKTVSVAISCEHASHDVPKSLKKLFQAKKMWLKTHRGYDIGALDVAEALQKEIGDRFFQGKFSRLVVDLNRSAKSRRLFSNVTQALTNDEKNKILHELYFPYRNDVYKFLKKSIEANRVVVHLSVHSFTPVLNGKSRDCDIGILYDPSSAMERKFANKLKDLLDVVFPDFKIRRNYPYQGKSDGLTREMRGKFKKAKYLGIELEFNQKLLGSISKERQTDLFVHHMAWALDGAIVAL